MVLPVTSNTTGSDLKSGADQLDMAKALSSELNNEPKLGDAPASNVPFNAVGSLQIMDDEESGDGGDIDTNASAIQSGGGADAPLSSSDNLPAPGASPMNEALAKPQTVVWQGIIKAIDRLSREGAYLAFSLISAKDYERCRRMNKSLFARLDDLTPNEKTIYKFTVTWLEEYKELEKTIQNNGLSKEEIEECSSMAAQIAKEQGIEVNPWIGLVAMLVVPIGMNVVTAIRLGNKGFNPGEHLAKNQQAPQPVPNKK